jgi:hypothetical protein
MDFLELRQGPSPVPPAPELQGVPNWATLSTATYPPALCASIHSIPSSDSSMGGPVSISARMIFASSHATLALRKRVATVPVIKVPSLASELAQTKRSCVFPKEVLSVVPNLLVPSEPM